MPEPERYTTDAYPSDRLYADGSLLLVFEVPAAALRVVAIQPRDPSRSSWIWPVVARYTTALTPSLRTYATGLPIGVAAPGVFVRSPQVHWPFTSASSMIRFVMLR